ncbi:MAG: hypothetical protein OSB65_19105, partial [Roseibacillus sp.]|nr:hypothetical protein [Roseibacillus sp.]
QEDESMSISITATLNHNALANQLLGLNDAKGNAFGVTAISPPAAPAHPTGGVGTFCVRLGMYGSPRVKILGGVGDQGFSLISFTGLPSKVSPHPFVSDLR